MKDYWNELSEKFSQLAIRERGLIGLSIFALIYLLWDYGFYQRVLQDQESLKNRMREVNLELTKVTAEEKILAKALTNDPNAAKQREVVRLEKELEALDANLESLSLGLVVADKLPEILRDVLVVNRELKLIGMKTHTVQRISIVTKADVEGDNKGKKGKEKDALTPEEEMEKILVGDKVLVSNGISFKLTEVPKDEPKEKEANFIGVYKHSVTIELEGKYFDVVRYLDDLESMTWRFYWEALDYNVDDYPKAKVKLQVYTLSTEKGVLSV